MSLSIIVVTSGRETLTRTLKSIQAQGLESQDEVLVVGNSDFIQAQTEAFGYRYIQDGPFGDWGQRERQAAMAHATGTHLLFMDDDDFYQTGAFDHIRQTIRVHPDRPLMFRMLAPTGHRIWVDRVVECGNVSGTQFVTPNVPAQLGTWGLTREGDFDFIVSTLATYPENSIIWCDALIVGCRDEGIPATSATRALRVLLVHPGASWSTADVEAGLRFGLQHHGVHVIPYRLDERIQWAHKWLFTMWRQKKKARPDLAKPNTADKMYHAGVGAIEMALRHQVDVVIVVSAMLLHPDIIVMMKRAGLRVTVLFTESPYDHEQELRIAKLVDGCWTNERSVLKDFRAVNDHAGYLPHAWHPERHDASLPTRDVPSHDVVFVGSGFRERVNWFNSIDWTGIDLGLYGTWKGLGLNASVPVAGAQVDNDMAGALYRRAKIGLNLYRTSKGWTVKGRRAPQITHAESLSPRAYELAACGAFHLSEDRAEVREVFGDLVPTFQTPIEAAALMRVWLADAAGRQRVAAALPACVAEASWVNRAATVIGDLQTLLTQRAA